MKKYFFLIAMLCAAVLTLGTLIWAFSLQGTLAIVKIDIFFRWLFILFGIAGLILLGIAIWYLLAVFKKRTSLSWRLNLPLGILAALGIVIPLFVLNYISGIPSGSVKDIPPYLILTDSTASGSLPAIALVQDTRKLKPWSLLYGSGNNQNSFHDPQPAYQHVYVFPGLLPDTEYSYRTGDAHDSFNTPPVNPPDLHFAVASDTHIGAGDNRLDLTLKMIKQIADPVNDFDYFFSVGDLVENGSSRSQWQEALTEMSPIISSIPAGFVPGNHDTLFRGLDYYHYYCCPDGIVTKSGSDLYYRIDNGPIHFLILDLEWSAETYSAAQAAWLEDQLKTIPDSDWKIVMSHGFYYSSGYVYHGRQWYDNPETIQALTPLFEKYKVDLVFSGHNHQMELLQHAGVTYIICGAFGGLPDPSRTYESPASIWYTAGQTGFMDVTVSGKKADLTFCDPDLNVLKDHTLQKP